ncbi:MAG: SpoIIE family protein phosphatase [Flavobacteriales bacterium]|nr:SpoIIE family protein phosphatase [Flavobacteriales bacterium]MBP9079085.1 SpoIIE family protein phosphatase [Flavobacteriales bacterium]
MRVRMTIGRRIGLGFGLFIFFALVVVVLTNGTIERSRTINQQINNVYGPSVDALVRLRNLVVNARTLAKHWALVESIPDAPEKTALIRLTGHDLPLLIDRIDTLQSWWDKDEVAAMSRTFQDMSLLFALQDSVQRMLPGFESYKDPVAYFNARDLAEEGGSLDRQTERVLEDLDGLIAKQSLKREALRGGMIESLDSLRFFVLYLGSALVVIGTILAILLVRGIVKPLRQLRAILLQLGKGIFPRVRIAATSDEIGDMSKALDGLVDGLKRTTDFSHAVAAGNFKAEYQPLSNDDVLGHALLMMRKELGERERILEEKVRERTEEMVRQKEEVERQSKRVVELYKNVTDSIRYAKRLQESILPPEQRIRELLPGSFVLYRPKDIVSGDFYWVEAIGDQIVFAAVDCTGHGVPGAFMSLVGHNGLNRVVKEGGRTRPGEVLDLLNRIGIDTLHKDRDQFVRDGMDMALCAFDPNTLRLEYAGANCPLYVVRGGELVQYAANKMPIGGVTQQQGPFKSHTVQLQQGDAVYVFSDGYADQFGGPKGKKFLYRQFREVLVRISTETPERKKALLNEAFSEWKGMREQVDDILVMGMRV